MVHVKDVETRSLKCNSRILKDVTRDFTSTEMIWQKNLRNTSMIGRSHWRLEQGLKSLETLKIYWPLEDQTPVIPMLDTMFVSYHLFDVFPTATDKICLFKTIVCFVHPSPSLSSHPKPMDPIEDEWRWACIFCTDESIGDRPMDSEHGGSYGEQPYSRKGYGPTCSSMLWKRCCYLVEDVPKHQWMARSNHLERI